MLVERAAVASWKLRRATRCEAVAALREGRRRGARVRPVAERADRRRRAAYPAREPGSALARLRFDAAGLDRLIGLWEDLAGAADEGWTSRSDHHDRLLALLGHPAGSDPKGLAVARTSLGLLADPDPSAAATLRAFCPERPPSSAGSGRASGTRR